jgi:pyruvate dehydrogenase E2 component (dihydrolipoamide acetyltransferase)
MAFEFKLPDIGEGVHEGEIIRWIVKAGDSIKEDQPIVEIATDKVTAEIPSPVHGVIKECRGNEGDIIQVGSIIAVIIDEAGSHGAASQEKASEKEAPPKKAEQSSELTETKTAVAASAAQKANGLVLAAPATRRMAREQGVDLADIAGSGPAGRVTPADLKQFTSLQSAGSMGTSSLQEQNADHSITVAQTFNSQGEQRIPFTPLRRKIAERLQQSKQTAPHFAYVEEVDATALLELHKNLQVDADAAQVRLSYLPFIIKAVIAGIRKFPMLNSRLDEAKKEMVYFKDCHIGVAVATPQGLVVPVIKNADQKNIITIAREINVLADKARQGKLAIDDLQGGTFTVSSIGSIGGLFGIPIINYPEAAILGVNKIEKRPVVRTIEGEDQIVIRSMLNLSISCDHRLIDGVDAAYFIKEVAACLENPGRFLLSMGQ